MPRTDGQQALRQPFPEHVRVLGLRALARANECAQHALQRTRHEGVWDSAVGELVIRSGWPVAQNVLHTL